MLLRCLTIGLLLLLGACSEQPSAQGYIEGEYIYVTTPVSGTIESRLDKGVMVKKGQPLFSLELQPESDAFAAAEETYKQSVASHEAIAANLVFAKKTYERYQILVPKRAIEQSLLDNAASDYQSLVAQLAEAKATIAENKARLAESQWTLEQKQGVAPIDAIIFDTYYRVGEYVVANQSILSLLPAQNIKVIFYVNEPALSRLHLQDKVGVKCDNCRQTIEGKISFISPSAEYTPPVIYSNETNEKLIYRIEAKFSEQDAYKLHPGQPVRVTYSSHE